MEEEKNDMLDTKEAGLFAVILVKMLADIRMKPNTTNAISYATPLLSAAAPALAGLGDIMNELQDAMKDGSSAEEMQDVLQYVTSRLPGKQEADLELLRDSVLWLLDGVKLAEKHIINKK